MAKAAHLAILRHGVAAWNAWRDANPQVQADLSGADLSGADLSGVNFVKADLSGADLSGADLSKVYISATIFGDNDLSEVKGLDSVQHKGPSIIGTNTLYRSGGKIPEAFLRGCGVQDSLIEYLPSLLGAMEP